MEGISLQRRVSQVRDMLREFKIDRTSIPQDRLDLSSRERTSAFPWRGQFSPGLVEILLERYATRHGLIVDPFAGSGTLLHECARRAIDSLGVEINPAALEFARFVETCNVPPAQRRSLLARLSRILSADFLTGDGEGLFAASRAPSDLHRLAGDILRAHRDDRSLQNLLAVTFMLAMGDKSLHSREQVATAFSKVRALVEVFPYTRRQITVVHGDARRVPVGEREASVVLTSPPYINVFNYHQNYRKAVELMGWRPLVVASSEMGANRKHRSNRFLTVIQYALDMSEALMEMRRILGAGGIAILVVGRESTVRGVPFRNGELLALIATGSCGFYIQNWHERSFVTRFGEHIFEDIIVLNPSGVPATTARDFARAVAVDALERQLPTTTGDVASDIHAAVASAARIQASPLFSAEEACERAVERGRAQAQAGV